MTRIFTTLALFSVAMLCANIVLGLMIGDFNEAFNDRKHQGEKIDAERKILREQSPRPREKLDELISRDQAIETAYTPIKQRAIVHGLVGVAAVLVTVLVNSICVTYFVGTSRWIREVVETYAFPLEWIDEANKIKRRTFPWAAGGMLVAVGIAALGQAANPLTIRAGTASWVTPHMIGAMLGTAFIAYSFLIQHQRIYANYAIIQRIVAKVREVRQAKGLDHEEEMPAMAK